MQQKAADESAYATFLQAKAVARQQQALNLLAMNNNGVANTGLLAANQKAVNNVSLGMIANDTDVPTGTELALLGAIAAQCPLEGGDAVYEARAFVEALTGETFDDLLLCASGSRPAEGRSAPLSLGEGQGVRLYPNPSTGTVHWTGAEGQALDLRAFNALGQLVAERRAVTGSADLSALPPGLYRLEFSNAASGFVATKTLAIERQ